MFEPAQPGRSCPTHYRYAPSVLAREPDLHAQTLYVVGGLYGNRYALECVLDMARNESGSATVVFNGDFNWFNVDADSFADINRAVLEHVALRGNVETEIARDDVDAGCGCAYPDTVGTAEVELSNQIILRLRETAIALPAIRSQLECLPMHRVAEVAGVRIAIVHGDAESLAGWGYSCDALGAPDGVPRLTAHFAAAGVRVIASSHTCLPVALTVGRDEGRCALFNNGAAGMPNFTGSHYGVFTRISELPAARALYGTRVGAAYVDAVAIHYDHARWVEAFLSNWPAASPAHVSYFKRISEGPQYESSSALRGAVMRSRSNTAVSSVSGASS